MAPGQSKNVSSTLRLGGAPSSPCQLSLPPLLPIQSLASGPQKAGSTRRNMSVGVRAGHEFLVALEVFLFHGNHFQRVPPVGLPYHLAAEGSFCLVFYPLYYEFLEGRLCQISFFYTM